jgi:hypothetical protein
MYRQARRSRHKIAGQAKGSLREGIGKEKREAGSEFAPPQARSPIS